MHESLVHILKLIKNPLLFCEHVYVHILVHVISKRSSEQLFNLHYTLPLKQEHHSVCKILSLSKNF